jgi:hypothetical protein
MKSFILLNLFALTTSFVCGQNISNLDSANGFKMFKLGTSRNQYISYINNSHYIEKNHTYSIEVNKFPSLGMAFGSKVSTISLEFDGDDKLRSITIPYALLPYNKNVNPKEIFKEAEISLGPPSDTSLGNEGSKYYNWVGKKVVLTLNIELVTASDQQYWYREVVFQNYPDTISGKKSAATVF